MIVNLCDTCVMLAEVAVDVVRVQADATYSNIHCYDPCVRVHDRLRPHRVNILGNMCT